MAVVIDQPVADFQAQATSGTSVSLAALRGQQVLIYFYPKDSTPGCTTEGQDFRDQHAAFQAAESDPDLLGLCALLSFAESDRWHALCRERGLPAGFPLDGQHVLAVEGLYGREIGESHPLYGDYRDAIRYVYDQTLRLIVHTSIGGNRVRIRVSNEFGAVPLRIGAARIGKCFSCFATLFGFTRKNSNYFIFR